jgi:hypothetical protein
MKQFKTLIILKHPRELVWTTMRDKLSELVPLVNDIESITTEKRDEEPDGRVRLVNVWAARPVIPSVLEGVLNPSMLRWTDRADYDPIKWECRWRIEPHFCPERTQCEGVTRYEPALGKAGTRVTFEGWLEVNAKDLPGVPSFLNSTIATAIESFITALIPGNFRKLTNALSTRLEHFPGREAAAG